MTTNKDMFLYFLSFIIAYSLGIFFLNVSFINDHLIWLFPIPITPIILRYIIIKRYKDEKRVSEILKQDFASMNYVVLSERPLTFKEQYENFEFQFGITLNGMSLDFLRYKNIMKRHFIVRNEKDHDFELVLTVIQSWSNKFRYTVESTSRIRD